MIPKFRVLNKQTDEFIPSENTIIQDGKLYLNYRDFEDGISAKSEIYEVMFEESENRNITKYVGMNKQKLIDKYTAEIAKLRPYCPNRNQSEEKLKLGIFTEFIADLKKLDESHKKIIPKCAHNFIQEGIDSGQDYFTIIICADSFANAKPQDEFSKWLRENSGLFIRSLLNGYEVEKEPLYYVTLPDTDKDSEVVYALEKKRDGNIEISLVNRRKLGVSDSTKLSEQEIKSVDERYQLFAKEIAK